VNADRLLALMMIVPKEAVEIVVRARADDEVFFSMPKGWKPPAELEDRIKRAPAQQFYESTKTHWRWRAQ